MVAKKTALGSKRPGWPTSRIKSDLRIEEDRNVGRSGEKSRPEGGQTPASGSKSVWTLRACRRSFLPGNSNRADVRGGDHGRGVGNGCCGRRAKLELSAITNSNVNGDSAVMMFSTMPSGKILMLRIAAHALKRQN